MSDRAAKDLSDRGGSTLRGTLLASGRQRPGWKPYVSPARDRDAERHAEVQATLARIRAQAARNFAASEVPDEH